MGLVRPVGSLRGGLGVLGGGARRGGRGGGAGGEDGPLAKVTRDAAVASPTERRSTCTLFTLQPRAVAGVRGWAAVARV